MSTGLMVAIVAVVVLAAVVVVALAVRSKQRRNSTSMGLPDLGALSTDGLDKAHTTSPPATDRPEQAEQTDRPEQAEQPRRRA